MTTKTNLTPLERSLHLRRDRLESELERVASKLDVIHALGANVYEVGAVIRFDKQFHEGGTTYKYCAIQSSEDAWYTSGPVGGGKAYTWDSLINWLAGGEVPTTEIWLVESYVRIEA